MEFLTRKKLGWTFAAGLLVLLTFVLLRKPLLHGTGWNYSYFFNSAWIMEFDDALKRGLFPPRWLYGADNGLGAPSFYFYPPMAFYVTALVAFFSASKTDYSQIAAWAAFYMTLASGLAMFGWLRRQAGDILAMAGAVAYVLAPHHQVDYFVRGSMGETMSYIALPLLMACLQRAAASRAWIPGLALSYAFLILSHLTISLLVSVTLLPVYGLYLVFQAPVQDRKAVLTRCVVGGLLGVAMAASYVGPAIFMQKYASLQWMWVGDYEPYKWTLLRPDLWPHHEFGLSMAYLAWGTGALGLAAILAVLGGDLSPRMKDALAWGAAVLAGLLLYLTPWVWRGPTGLLLHKVQFPFRLLVGMEFAAITAVVLAAAAGRWVRLLVLAPFCLIPLERGFHLQDGGIKMHEVQSGDLLNEEVRMRIAARRVPDEHLPNGFDPAGKLFVADSPTLSAFAALPLAVPQDGGAARVTAASTFRDGTVAVAVDAARPTPIVVRKFYFPTWEVGRVQPGRDLTLKTAPHGPERLLSFTAEPGRHTYRIRIVRSTLEKVCDAISILALLLGAWLLVPSLVEALKKFRKAAI